MTTSETQIVTDERSATCRPTKHTPSGDAVQDNFGAGRVEAPQASDHREKGGHAAGVVDESSTAGAVGSSVVGDGPHPFDNPDDLMLGGLLRGIAAITEHTPDATVDMFQRALVREADALEQATDLLNTRLIERDRKAGAA